MMPFFSQATPEPEALVQILLVVSLFSNIGMALATIYIARHSAGTRREIFPDPLRVENTYASVSEKDCGARHELSTKGIAQLHNQLLTMETSREVQRNLASESQSKIYMHIENVRIELIERMEKNGSVMNQGFQDIERAIGRLEGRISK